MSQHDSVQKVLEELRTYRKRIDDSENFIELKYVLACMINDLIEKIIREED